MGGVGGAVRWRQEAKRLALRTGTRAYRRYVYLIFPERIRMHRTVEQWLSTAPPTARILDIGGGNALLEKAARRSAPDRRYLSCDVAPTDVTDVVADGKALPHPPAAFDAVMAIEVLEHLLEPPALVREAARVLLPGGIFIATTPFMYGIHDFRDYFRFTPKGFEALLADSDLQLVATRQRGGTFTSVTGLLRNRMERCIVGDPEDWRAVGRKEKARWLLAALLRTPWALLTLGALALDDAVDQESKSAAGFFFLCRKTS